MKLSKAFFVMPSNLGIYPWVMLSTGPYASGVLRSSTLVASTGHPYTLTLVLVAPLYKKRTSVQRTLSIRLSKKRLTTLVSNLHTKSCMPPISERAKRCTNTLHMSVFFTPFGTRPKKGEGSKVLRRRHHYATRNAGRRFTTWFDHHEDARALASRGPSVRDQKHGTWSSMASDSHGGCVPLVCTTDRLALCRTRRRRRHR